jgi:polysaccharide export outer membrane protein
MRSSSSLKHCIGKLALALASLGLLVLASCTAGGPKAPPVSATPADTANYVIGPGDNLEISVWRSPELSTKVPVRPDGRISTPLVEDIVAAGRTPAELGRDIEVRLKKYVSDPIVTVIVSSFVGPYSQQIRIVGEAVTPKAIPFQAHMTALDAMIAVGGLTAYAAGNRAKLVRNANGQEVTTIIRLTDLLKDGDMSANTDLQPGDVIIIPQSYF